MKSKGSSVSKDSGNEIPSLTNKTFLDYKFHLEMLHKNSTPFTFMVYNSFNENKRVLFIQLNLVKY